MALELSPTVKTQGTCPKCGYLRQVTDTAPEWQCPKCGVAYAKVSTLNTPIDKNKSNHYSAHHLAQVSARYNQIQRLLSLLLLLSLSICLLAWYHKGDLPVRQDIDNAMFQEPIQKPSKATAFEFQYRSTDYEVVPVADYELWGVVVTHNDIDGFMDITHDADSVDIKDICVVWGDNLKTGDYRKVAYYSGDFVCYFSYGPDVTFIHNQLSNSHLLSDNASVREEISRVNIGDQIRLSGMLVNYRPSGKNTSWRNSSVTRDDQGNGACEVVFVESFETMRHNNVHWHQLYHWMIFITAVFLILKLIILYRESTHTIS